LVGFKGILLTALLLTVGCNNIFAPRLGDIEDGDGLYKRDMLSPADVLHNFRYAYSYRDSLIYSTIIDSQFIFLYYEAQDEGGSGHYASWGRDIDLRTTGGLFRAFSYINLVWNAGLDSQFYQLDGEEILQQEESYFDSCNFAEMSRGFQLNLGENIYLQGTARFEFRKSPYDRQWRLSAWRDESF